MKRNDITMSIGLLFIFIVLVATIIVGDRLSPLGVSVGISVTLFRIWQICVAVATGSCVALFFWTALAKDSTPKTTMTAKEVPMQSIEETLRQRVAEMPVPRPVPKPAYVAPTSRAVPEAEPLRPIIREVQPMPTIDELRDIKIVDDEPEQEPEREEEYDENPYQEAY